MSESKYPAVVVWSDSDDSFLAISVQLDGCMADGCTREEALHNLEFVIQEWLVSAEQLGWTVPEPLKHEDYEKAHLQEVQASQAKFEAAITARAQEIVDQLMPKLLKQIQAPSPEDWWKNLPGGRSMKLPELVSRKP